MSDAATKSDDDVNAVSETPPASAESVAEEIDVVLDASQDVDEGGEQETDLDDTADNDAGKSEDKDGESLEAGDEDNDYCGPDGERLRESMLQVLSQNEFTPISVPRVSYDPDVTEFPDSYKNNAAKELKAIAYCKRFVLHYNHLFHRRRPLFLMPKNECRVKKVVCTTVNPTQLPYSDLLDWPDIATFVAHYVLYEKLSDPLELPNTLFAPQTVFKRKRGHCFDLSTLLCSMLIGSGYDAYVVSGYASREVCSMNLSYTRCPLIEDDVKVYPRPMERHVRKYTVRPPRLYSSEYLLRIKRKHERIEKSAKAEVFAEKEAHRKMAEAPPEDELHGWRVHSWVIVLAGRRDIDTTFFIEPTTGFSHPTDWDEYHGIESLWNHLNYYVNVQQDNALPSTVKLNYDIGDSREWEYIFPGQDLHVARATVQEPGTGSGRKRRSIFDIRDAQCLAEKHFDMPPSWTLPLKLTRDEYEERYPMGKACWWFKKAQVEYFSHYLMPTGLVKKLTVYSDLACKNVDYITELFAHRHDLLVQRFTHHPSGRTIETFDDGREDFLKEHQYFAETPGPETQRTFTFFRFRRLDQLYKREEGPDFIKEWYESRPDHKVYRETHFGPTGRVHEEGHEFENCRPIEYVIERFSRNPSKPANEDIAEVTYSVSTDEIDLTYHVEEHRIVRSTRHFTKPDRWWDDTVYLDWKPELHWNFQADVYAKPMCELALYQMMVDLMKREALSRAGIRRTEKETRRLLRNRTNEENGLKLVTTYFDADRLPETRTARLKEKARIREEQLLKKMDIIRDYLEPYLHRLGLSAVTNRRQAARIKENVMEDLKSRFVYQMDAMRDAYEHIKNEIMRMQIDHCHGLPFIAVSQLADADSELTTKMFTAHILEERMNQFKVSSPIKYKALYNRLRTDPRMAPFM